VIHSLGKAAADSLASPVSIFSVVLVGGWDNNSTGNDDFNFPAKRNQIIFILRTVHINTS